MALEMKDEVFTRQRAVAEAFKRAGKTCAKGDS
jgi:hypothetical protein